ncbi:MAG: ATP-binding protein [Mycobacteriales bacterium]
MKQNSAFAGRAVELAALRRWWENAAERPALVWGRRRVGKTALISHFAETLPRVIFHTGTGEPVSAELEMLSRKAAEAFPTDPRNLNDHPYRDWHDALDHLARCAAQEPALLILDEFPELIATSPSLPGILRAFLDQSAHRTALRLLVCGSAVRTMWSIQESRAPLYGRFNLTLPIYPFRPHEAALMLPDLPAADRALVYGVVGGMPLYLSWWDQHASISANLLRLMGQPGSPLLTEGRLIGLTEVGGGTQSSGVLHAIAAGKTRHSEIADAIGADPTRIVERLIEARLVERMIPVTEDPWRSRRRMYRIADNFLSFYLGPLLRHRSEIERGRGASIMPALLRALDPHMGAVYEEAFREHLRHLADADELGSDIVAIGPWWGPDGQNEIDAVVVAQPDRTRLAVAVGEAKWARRLDGARITQQLERKAAALPDEPKDVRFIVCARDEVNHAPPDTLVITAADIFSAPRA